MAATRDMTDGQHWAIEDVWPNPDNPRRNTETDPSFEGLVESIRSQGILQPLLINSGGMILAGHRRYFAALKLNLTQVPVRVLSSSNNQELVPLIENLQREDLSVLEVADYFLQCQKKHGMNLASIAAITGISNTTVGKYIRLAEGPPEIRERVERDDIPLDAAFELLRHGPELIREVVKLPVVTKQIVRDRAKGNTVPPNEQRLTKQDRTRLEFGRMIEKLEDVDAGLDRYRHMRTAQSSIRQAQAHIRQASMKILEEMVDKDKREPQSAETFNRSSLLNSTL